MRTKHLFYTLALSAAFAACSQEEIVNAPAVQKDNSFGNYVGEVYTGGISIVKDGEGVDSRMSITNGNPSWADGDKVGLVWTNAIVNGSPLEAPWTAWPTTDKIFSNTRMTYDAASKDFFMTDGQVFKGMYFAYYPFNEAIQSVQKFKVSQANVQEQTNSSTETLNQVATDLVWMSQRYENDEEVMTPATFLYPLTADNESGKAEHVGIRMKPFSNILDARFNVVDKKADAATSLDPKDVIVEKVVLGTRLNGSGTPASQEFGGLADFPTVAAFDLSKWQGLAGSDFGIPSSGQSGKDGRKLTVNSVDASAVDFYTGENKVGTVTVGFADNGSKNEGKMQRVNFMFLPHKNYGKANNSDKQVYEIKVVTDYGYAIIPETEWMKDVTNNGGLFVNNGGKKDEGQAYLTESFLMKNLTERIGMQAVRYFNLDIADLIYNDRDVASMDDLLDVLTRWNKLGKYGELRVNVKSSNDFADFDWCADSKYSEIVEFLADSRNVLKVQGNWMYLSGETHIEDTQYNQLVFENAAVEQTDGKMTIEGEEKIEVLTINEDVELEMPENAKVEVLVFSNLGNTAIATEAELVATVVFKNFGNVTIAQNGKMTTLDLENDGEITTNGIIGVSSEMKNNGEFHILTHSNTNATTFTNEGKVYYDEQGVCSKITNDYANGGRVIATILDGAEPNTLADYIVAANSFKCTDLRIYKNDFFTIGQWDNSLYAKKLDSFKNVEMYNGVEIVFTKGLKMKNATVTIKEDAVVTWRKGTTVETPEFDIKAVVLEAGATLNVSGIDVLNDVPTKLQIGSGKQTTIDGIACFENGNKNTETITADDGTSGSIEVK